MNFGVGVEHFDAVRAEPRCGRRFAHADRTGQSDYQHHEPLDILGDEVIKFRRHFGPDAEPLFKARHSLMQKHAKAIDGDEAVSLGRFQEFGCERHVDEIGGNAQPWRAREKSISGLPAPFIPSVVALTMTAASGSMLLSQCPGPCA